MQGIANLNRSQSTKQLEERKNPIAPNNILLENKSKLFKSNALRIIGKPTDENA